METERLSYSIEKAVALLGIGRNTAYEAAKSGDLPSIRMGGRILVPRVAITRLIDQAVSGAQPEAA